MKFLSGVGTKFSIIAEFFHFLWARRLWWMIPMFMILIMLGILMLLTHGSAIAPFIYPLF